jgi:hypothetical protein
VVDSLVPATLGCEQLTIEQNPLKLAKQKNSGKIRRSSKNSGPVSRADRNPKDREAQLARNGANHCASRKALK